MWTSHDKCTHLLHLLGVRSYPQMGIKVDGIKCSRLCQAGEAGLDFFAALSRVLWFSCLILWQHIPPVKLLETWF